MELLVSIIVISVAVESLTSIVLYEESLFHTALWRHVQVKLKNWSLLYKFSKCNYCISFWISVILSICVFDWTSMLPLVVLAVWRLSHLFDAVYRYYLIRSFDVEG